MTIIAFAGPSLPERERKPFRGVTWKPPAEAGDLLRLDIDPSTTLCLIDGYFDHRPAVRHKEILLLLAEGVRVFGASSIGALRGAEMDAFGMIGVGAIYRAYKRGNLQGDDEVALIHGSAEWDWKGLSLPLVDVRATLCQARRREMIGRGEARGLLEAALAVHYVDRTWEAIGAACRDPQGPALVSTLKEYAVPQKQLDARDCIRAAIENAPREVERPSLVRTPFLDALAEECGTTLASKVLGLGR